MINTHVTDWNSTRRALDQLEREAGLERRWRPVPPDNWTREPASTSRITCSNTDMFQVGLPLRWMIEETRYYGIVYAVSAGAYIDVLGPAISGTIQMLWVGRPDGLVAKSYSVLGDFGTGLGDVALFANGQSPTWQQSPAYLVHWSMRNLAAGTPAVRLAPRLRTADYVSAENGGGSGGGVTLSTGNLTHGAAASVDATKYRTVFDDRIDLRVSVAADPGTPAQNLTANFMFVLE